MKYLLLFVLAGCVTRQEIEGNIRLSDGLPAELCAKYPELIEYGMYRIVKCVDRHVHGCENGEEAYKELLPYCLPRAQEELCADRDKVAAWLNALAKPKP